MSRRGTAALLVLAASTAVLLSACSPATTVNSTTESLRVVSLSATGTADATPDAARASLSVVTNDPASAQAAQEAAAIATTEVLDALKAAGVAEADIATQSVNVGPTYTYTADGGQTPTGFQASQSLTVTLRDLATAGATVDAVVAAGGNAVRVDALSTFVTDPSVALDQARAQAVGIAQAQAEQYAQLLGFTLGPVASVTESSTSAVPAPMAMSDAVAGAEKVPTPVEAGTTQVSVSISIAWSIEG
jgi:uncharacterized protein YggE